MCISCYLIVIPVTKVVSDKGWISWIDFTCVVAVGPGEQEKDEDYKDGGKQDRGKKDGSLVCQFLCFWFCFFFLKWKLCVTTVSVNPHIRIKYNIYKTLLLTCCIIFSSLTIIMMWFNFTLFISIIMFWKYCVDCISAVSWSWGSSSCFY